MALSACWNVQPHDFKITLPKEKWKSLIDEIVDLNYEIPGNKHFKTNAFFKFYLESEEITPKYPGGYRFDSDNNLELFLNAGQRGLRPAKEDVQNPLALFVSEVDRRTDNRKSKEASSVNEKLFDDENAFKTFLSKATSLKFDSSQQKHDLGDVEKDYKTQIKKKSEGNKYWDKGLYLSVLNAVNDNRKGMCPESEKQMSTLKKGNYFKHIYEEIHCVFFKITVENEGGKLPLFKFIIPDQPSASDTCTPYADGDQNTESVPKTHLTKRPKPDQLQNPIAEKGARSPAQKGGDKIAPGQGDSSSSKGRQTSTEISSMDQVFSALMNQLRSAYDSFKTAHNSNKRGNAAGLENLLRTNVYPKLDQREAYTIEANEALWAKIKEYLKKNGGTPESLTEIYNIFDGKEWFEEDPATGNLRNILDACISLWKFQSLNPAISASAVAS